MIERQMRLALVRILIALAVPILVSAHFASGWAQVTPQTDPRQQVVTGPHQNDPSQSTASLELPFPGNRRHTGDTPIDTKVVWNAFDTL
jgi:hypothetical protein